MVAMMPGMLPAYEYMDRISTDQVHNPSYTDMHIRLPVSVTGHQAAVPFISA